MAGSDPQQGERRAVWRASPLLPIPQRVHADTQRLGELLLGETHEASQGRHILPRQPASR